MWWQKHGTVEARSLITKGVTWQQQCPPALLSRNCKQKTQGEVGQALELIREYQQLGAVKEVPWEGTKHLVPWFVVEKTDGGKKKRRLISDCREVNQFLTPKRFPQTAGNKFSHTL